MTDCEHSTKIVISVHQHLSISRCAWCNWFFVTTNIDGKHETVFSCPPPRQDWNGADKMADSIESAFPDSCSPALMVHCMNVFDGTADPEIDMGNADCKKAENTPFSCWCGKYGGEGVGHGE